jgi:hypothetical protein
VATISWITPDDVVGVCPDADPADLDGPIEMASAILYDLTGRRWPGPQPDVVRPCSPVRSLGGPVPLLDHGAMTNVSGWCGCAQPTLCGCNTPGLVVLPGWPVVSVDAVHLDGVLLDPAQYRALGQHLVRVDGLDWPCCQDWTVPGDQPGAFQVAYTWGASPDEAGQYACAVLACELWKASPASGAQGDGACRLPKRVTTVTRQGVTFAMLDPMAMFPDGLTGIPEVDLWLGAQRYGDAHRPAIVMVPGARQRNLREPTAPVVNP